MDDDRQSVARQIPFNRPFIVGKELHYIAQAVQGGQLAGDGRFTRLCEEWMQSRFGGKRVLLTHSCTAALEMAAILADVGSGDEVIMPSYTFSSTANAFALRGAEIRFVDIEPDTLNISVEGVKSAVTPRTRAIVPVHYAGVACEMDEILLIASRPGALVIEDAAQGVNARYKGRYLGTLGQLAAYSFHETKNFISGEGGALVINDGRFVARAEIIRQKGTDRARFLRGEVDKYTWVDIGSSYPPSELVAAFLYAQLEESETISRKRMAIYGRYRDGLEGLRLSGCLRLPVVPPGRDHNAHMFYVIAESPVVRDSLIKHLRSRHVHAIFHYVPLHLSPMGQKMGYKEGDLPVTEDLAARLIRLPFYFELSESDQDRVIAAVQEFYGEGI
jgi:dTDP-4-amino-4,6-dideoxygalactose transaminase